MMKVENMCNSDFSGDFAPRPSVYFGVKMAPSSEAPKPANKCALSFILSETPSSNLELLGSVSKSFSKRKRTASSSSTTTRKATRSDTQVSIQRATTIATPEGNNTALPVKKGSKFCVVDGCMSRAKHAKRCWRHGGSVKCKVADCDNRAKSKGVCWSHGGGTLCSFDKCDTISVSNGFCWAHGGGKRCAVHQCSKPAYERTQNYCTAHFEELHAAGYGGGGSFVGV